jgi:hypothetical protein
MPANAAFSTLLTGYPHIFCRLRDGLALKSARILPPAGGHFPKNLRSYQQRVLDSFSPLARPATRKE